MVKEEEAVDERETVSLSPKTLCDLLALSNVMSDAAEEPLFDDRCPYCKKVAGDVDRLIEADQKIEAMREVTEASVMEAAEELGPDLTQLKSDMGAPEAEKHLQETMRLSQALGIEGTPALVIGDELVPGALSFGRLRDLVANAREVR